MSKNVKTAANTPGRNDPCPCGSGKKYKKCCGQSATNKHMWESDLVIRDAFALFQQGRLNEARELCESVITKNSINGGVYHLLGIILAQEGDYNLAREMLLHATETLPVDPPVYANLALVEKKLGNTETAIKHAKHATNIQPDNAEAHNILGSLYREKGQFNLAINEADQAVKLRPENLDYRLNLALTYHKLNQIDKAEDIYKNILLDSPGYVKAQINLGSLYLLEKRWKKAYERYAIAERSTPDDPELMSNIGVALLHLKELAEAERYCYKAVELNPSFTGGYLNLAIVLETSEKLDECAEVYIKLMELDPLREEAYSFLISHYVDMDEYGNACELCDCVLDSPGELGDVLGSCLTVYATARKWNKYKACLKSMDEDYRHANQLKVPVKQNLLGYHYTNFLTAEEIYIRTKLVARRIEGSLSGCHFNKYNSERDKHKKLKVGYVSPDFRMHSVAHFITPILEYHNKQEFEIYCYYNHNYTDSKTEQIKRLADRFFEVSEMNDSELAQKINNDQIDILIDLAGHTGRSRLAMFAYKPAPIQITYLGYPNTTGLSPIDFRITDAYADPDGANLYTETLIKLPQSFLCFGKLDFEGMVTDAPVIKNNYITFGCFNNSLKIAEEDVELWSKLLLRIENSRLLLKGRGIDSRFVQENMLGEFKNCGVNSERIIFLSRTETLDEHYNCYKSVDIALDTFPYNGTTTTCDALWMGVPVITLYGNHHAQRVTGSILANADLGNLIAKNPEQYIKIAIELSSDYKNLNSVRKNIWKKIRASILCDPKGFMKHLESAYRSAWADYVERL